MNPPFSAEQFFAVFGAYNEAVWPVQLVLLGLGAAVPFVAWGSDGWRSRAISVALSSLWIWMAIAYHWSFFTAINPAARIFGAVFLAQGLLHLWFGLRSELRFELRGEVTGWVGGALVLYALIVYPLLGLASGREPVTQPSFGLPCPTTIFTLGVLLWATPKVPWPLLVIPVVWSVIGGSAARAFGVLEDLALPLSAAISLLFLLRERRIVGRAALRRAGA